MNIDAFVQRLKEAMAELSVNRFAQKCGFPESTMRKYLSGRSLPGTDNLVAIAKASGLAISWLATGEGPMRPGDVPQLIPAGDQIPVPLHSLAASAGNGAFCDSDHAEMVMVPKMMIEQSGVPLKDLCLVRASGSSMEPSIRDGDILFVDRGERGRKKADGTYILRLNDTLLVKNVQVLPNGSIELSSSNKEFRPIVITHDDPPRDFALLARVVSGVRRF